MELIAYLQKMYKAGLAFVPESCRWNYNAMWCDARLRLLAFPMEQRQILGWIEVHAGGLLNPRAGDFPPPLYRLPGEDAEAYLVRCLDAAAGRYGRTPARDIEQARLHNDAVKKRA